MTPYLQAPGNSGKEKLLFNLKTSAGETGSGRPGPVESMQVITLSCNKSHILTRSRDQGQKSDNFSLNR